MGHRFPRAPLRSSNSSRSILPLAKRFSRTVKGSLGRFDWRARYNRVNSESPTPHRPPLRRSFAAAEASLNRLRPTLDPFLCVRPILLESIRLFTSSSPPSRAGPALVAASFYPTSGDLNRLPRFLVRFGARGSTGERGTASPRPEGDAPAPAARPPGITPGSTPARGFAGGRGAQAWRAAARARTACPDPDDPYPPWSEPRLRNAPGGTAGVDRLEAQDRCASVQSPTCKNPAPVEP